MLSYDQQACWPSRRSPAVASLKYQQSCLCLPSPRYFCIIHLVLSCESGRSNLVLRPWSPPSSPHNPSDFAPPADLLATTYPQICTACITISLLSTLDQSLCSCSKVVSVFHLKDLIGHNTKSPLPKYFVESADFSLIQCC